ncbi:amidohydrolase family protein [Rhodoplanes sp. Z2-YC6860]|uniref:amidohydrolase family protein n=1 Tax=Rhodoplanes sp. Z2-YC6860 TaxID=674703 RepID=UPI00078D42E0|nr:amidohydrolase family protein [Rhodoplanes sp. Z2-YC6860]AMN44353.1 TIM-barrel fold metal-dependent hydrolase [Rhodoplanes sp. Z2-YC6860]
MPQLIDFHHHARPAAFFEALAETGRTTMGGRPFPKGWTAREALAFMDRMGIATAVVSAPDADLLYRDRAIAVRLARLLNELFADCIRSHPARFGAFASLPMPHVSDTLHEIDHAFDHLRLDGVMLSTSYDGQYLGSDLFEPVLASLNARNALVFVHPVTPPGLNLLALDFPASLLEYAFDTTRCIANLLRHSIPVRYPNIRFIFSHAGGAMPYLLHRMTLMESFLTPGHVLQADRDRDAIRQGLRHFHYDVALAAFDPVFDLLRDVVGLDRIVFGSDYPQVPDSYVEASVRTLAASPRLDDEARTRIGRANGETLLSRSR